MKIPFNLCLAATAAMLLAGCGGSSNDGGGDGSPVEQPDRMGRPGINTVLIGTPLKDAYNQAANRDDWPALFQAEMQSRIELVDTLDGNTGNTVVDSSTLAGLLVDDRLIIDTSIPDCDAYLAVELGLPGCGGRTLARDVVDDTLATLVGVGSQASDNVDLDSAFLASFPFVGPPNGAQVDRMGRPAINSVLIPSNLRDAYNLAADRATWKSLFKGTITAGLVVVDGLDGVPGNAPLNDSAALAEIVVDDRLFINTSIPTCDVFLAVELNNQNSCGGRSLEIDVIDNVLAALVGGPISDNVDNDSIFFADFPFLSDPN